MHELRTVGPAEKSMKTVVAISDLHGNLPDNIPECDLLLVGGDICPYYDHSMMTQAVWLSRKFADWVRRLPAKEVVVIAGNHDLIFERQPALIKSLKRDFPFVYLQDEAYVSR